MATSDADIEDNASADDRRADDRRADDVLADIGYNEALKQHFGLRAGTKDGVLEIVAGGYRVAVPLGAGSDWHHYCLTYDGPSRGGKGPSPCTSTARPRGRGAAWCLTRGTRTRCASARTPRGRRPSRAPWTRSPERRRL